jgi:heme/copper-type cytochrome/quinol oxidase subunit 1
MARRVLFAAVPLLLGAALLVAGIVLWFRTSASFGWFAYAPLTDQTFVPVTPGPGWLSLVLAVVGAALLAGWTGFLLGRRRGASG